MVSNILLSGMRFPGLGSYNLTDKAIVQDRKNNANRFRIVGVKKDFWSAHTYSLLVIIKIEPPKSKIQ